MVSSVNCDSLQHVRFQRNGELSLISRVFRAVASIFLAPFACFRSNREPYLDLIDRKVVHHEKVVEAHALAIPSCPQFEEERFQMMAAHETRADQAREHLKRELATAVERELPSAIPSQKSDPLLQIGVNDLLSRFVTATD